MAASATAAAAVAQALKTAVCVGRQDMLARPRAPSCRVAGYWAATKTGASSFTASAVVLSFRCLPKHGASLRCSVRARGGCSTPAHDGMAASGKLRSGSCCREVDLLHPCRFDGLGAGNDGWQPRP